MYIYIYVYTYMHKCTNIYVDIYTDIYICRQGERVIYTYRLLDSYIHIYTYESGGHPDMIVT